MKIIGPTYDKAKDLARKALPAPVWSTLRLLWARYSFGTFRRRIVRHRYGRHEFCMELVDFDGAYWYDRDYDDFPEIAELDRAGHLNGSKVFNAGANQCLQAMVMAKAVGPEGFVWAIEPNARNAAAARRNLELNGVSNCAVLEAAVSRSEGKILINQAMNGQVSLDRIGAREVRATSIDNLAAELGAPDVLYIDVEGFECAALEGARETLRIHRPNCFVEVHRGIGLEKLGGSVAELLSFFAAEAYQVFYNDTRDNVFREATDYSKLPNRRFFLLALARERPKAQRV